MDFRSIINLSVQPCAFPFCSNPLCLNSSVLLPSTHNSNMSDSNTLKEAVIRQVQLESNQANIRVLMEVRSPQFAPASFPCAG